MRSTRAVIYLDNLRNNIQSIRRAVKPGTRMCVTVKANAYGHGAVTVAKTVLACGVEYLAVATVDEGRELRDGGITAPVLLFSLCTPEEAADVVACGLTPFVTDEAYCALFEQAAAAAGVTCTVHLAVDTGMGRIGCMPDQAADVAAYIQKCSHLKLGGMCTHFAFADNVQQEGRQYTERQIAAFTHAVESVRNAGIDPGIRHCSSSAALLEYPDMQLDMVRPGIIVYGYYPDEVDAAYLAAAGRPLDIRPVMAFETQVVAVRHFEPGASVSYGRTWTADVPTDIAVLPAGYADGLLRRCSPGLQVAVNGSAYPVRGRICMDQCMVDIGNGNSRVKRWDKAVIFGPRESGALQTADDIARSTGTISYEILTGISRRVPRVYVGELPV